VPNSCSSYGSTPNLPAPTTAACGWIVLSELWRDQAAIEAHRAKPGHSHAWQDALIEFKRVIVYDTE
jgi:quinol monooxygenase YgiN